MTAQQALPGAEDVLERDPLDFNRTPAWVVQLLVPYLGAPRTVLDVGCGDGAIGRVLRETFWDSRIAGVECHEQRREAARSSRHVRGEHARMTYTAGAWNRDWLTWHGLRGETFAEDFGDAPDLIISNPPFGLAALAFLQHAVERVAPGGTVAFLLPTHWDHDPDVESGFARQRFLDALRTPDGREGYAKLAVVGGGPHPARPSFKKGGTASDRYAWFLFGAKWAGQPSRRLHALPPESEPTQLGLL